MNILIVTQYFWPENFRINDLVEELLKRNHTVTVLTGKPNYPGGSIFKSYTDDPSKFNKFKNAKILRVPIIARGKSKIKLLFNYLSYIISASLIGIIKLKGLKFDIVFIYEPSPITVALPGIFIGYFKKSTTILWVLDLWPESLQGVGVLKSKYIIYIIKLLVRFIYTRCDIVLGQSRSFVKNIQNYLKDKKKVIYFPNWSEEIFKDNNIYPSKKLDYRPEVFNVMFAGNIGEAQDLPSILKAVSFLRENKNIRWIIVGNGNKYNWLMERIKKLNLDNCIKVLGSYPIKEMPSLYAHADALLVSLKDEYVFNLTIPGKIQSYLQFGTPILGMLNGEGNALINDNKVGFCVQAGDASGLSKNIIKMSKMRKSDLDQLGKNGVALAKKEFDRARLMDRLENIFYDKN